VVCSEVGEVNQRARPEAADAGVQSRTNRSSASYFTMRERRIFEVAEDWFHLIVVPRPEDRTELSWVNAPILLLPFMPLLAVAYLARRPGTRLLRALCLPLVLMGTTRIFFAYYFSTPGANEYNWAMGM